MPRYGSDYCAWVLEWLEGEYRLEDEDDLEDFHPDGWPFSNRGCNYKLSPDESRKLSSPEKLCHICKKKLEPSTYLFRVLYEDGGKQRTSTLQAPTKIAAAKRVRERHPDAFVKKCAVKKVFKIAGRTCKECLKKLSVKAEERKPILDGYTR